MGCTLTNNRHSSVDKFVREACKENRDKIKLLLLGAGQSGKTTFLKQLKLINLQGFTDEEKQEYIDVVYANVFYCIKTLIQKCREFGYEIENNDIADEILTYDEAYDIIDETISRNIKMMFNEQAIQDTFKRSNEFQLLDCCQYYMDNLDEISKEGYLPSDQDILHSRSMTTGISRLEFECKGAPFEIVDVGGQRSERRKWLHCFNEVTAVIFLVGISEYDQMCQEDQSTNRMDESIYLWEQIINSRYFTEVDIILFLNKEDLFRKKIKKVDMKVCFPDYSGGKNVEKALKFLREKFASKSPDREIFKHVTCATDTKNIKTVMEDVTTICLMNSLKDSGF
eukprot:TRINITY_DN11248_c0_g1_i1.p1 TRINITY_DN11248_c0_g1~~TRINITY_DN11248_c0_g1_i1.p1  ORF type:complete len:340 (+),score=78.42 TRINITY_DN11248_c0_g1_i1:70-1089(+)